MISRLLYNLAQAQELVPCPDGTMADPKIGCVPIPGNVLSPESSVLEIILKVSYYLMGVAAFLAVIFLIYGAIRYATAAGEQDQIDRAKRTMLWSVLGLGISLLANQIVQFLLDTIK